MPCIVPCMNSSRGAVESTSSTARRRPEGPHAGVVGAVSTGLFIASLAVVAFLGGGRALSSSFVDGYSDFLAHHGLPARASANVQLGTAGHLHTPEPVQ